MWIIGDSLLNITVPNLMNWRNGSGKFNYINKTYEMTPYTVSDTNNFLVQIQKGPARAINANNYLPELILVVMSDVIPGEKILSLKSEFYIQKIMQIIRESIVRRQDQLPKKAKPLFETKILMTKALPRPQDQDFKIRRRKYNKQMDVAGKQYNIETIHVNDILPSDQRMFEGPDLSDMGKRKMWMMISEKIKNSDTSDVEAMNKIRKERRTGEIDKGNNNTWLWLNTRQRRNYLGIEVNRPNRETFQRQHETVQRHQHEHRSLMNNFNQLQRQALIQDHIDRRNRRYGPNGAGEWHSVMNFVNNLERQPGEQGFQFQNRINEVYDRRVNRMFQSGDGAHMTMYNYHRRRQNPNS